MLFFPLGDLQYTEYHGHRRLELLEEWIDKKLSVSSTSQTAASVDETDKFIEN